MRQVGRTQRGLRRDPAPSRLAYRLDRLRLTPGYRAALRYGLPVVALAGLALFGATNPQIRERVELAASDLRRSIEERPEFMVRLMAIGGASRELSEDIREVLPIDFPVSSFDLDLAAMRETLLSLDPVARAELRIRNGGILQVDIEEREPVLVWRGPHGVEVLGGDGHRIGALRARAERPDLPLVTGAGADRAVPEARALFAAARPLAARLRGLVRMGERRWDMVLDRGQRIMLPEKAPVRALERVIALDQAQDLLARDVVAVDMRNGSRPTVRLARRAVTELLRIRGISEGETGR